MAWRTTLTTAAEGRHLRTWTHTHTRRVVNYEIFVPFLERGDEINQL